MKITKNDKGEFISVSCKNFNIPFSPERGFGFFAENDGIKYYIPMENNKKEYKGARNGINYSMVLTEKENYAVLDISITNSSGYDCHSKIGFSLGIDSYMEKYPQWNNSFFPTMLRCEKTHLWGYFMTPEGNILALSTDSGVSSYDIRYSTDSMQSGHFGHRILGCDIIFIQNSRLPERHPADLKILKKNETYNNRIFFIPAGNFAEAISGISGYSGVPVIQSDKYTYEPGEKPDYKITYSGNYTIKLTSPSGEDIPSDSYFKNHGIYTLNVAADNGKQAQALFFCRKGWSFYLKSAAEEAFNKPPSATTHTESWYGLFSAFLWAKHSKDEKLYKKAIRCFDEIMPLMFDFERHIPLVIPERIQNTAVLLSLLTDIYEYDPENNISYLEHASLFADYLIKYQDGEGAYRNKGTHYTCVIYIAKSILELAAAEKNSGSDELNKKSREHYISAGKAVDELVRNLDNIETEGEQTFEDGMISCSALQIAMYATTLPESEREPYIKAAEYMINKHLCLEQRIIPDCRMNGGSLRYWESQYDVMIRSNMMNSPHGWSAWTAYAQYYLYMLTGKKIYLTNLINTISACAQLMDLNGNLRWAFCAQPYVKARALQPDLKNEISDGYDFVDLKEPAYRGKYDLKEYCEEYIDMISGWYRTGDSKLTGGYSFCPLIFDGFEVNCDNQGGCCDNDVHEIFKCIEETVFSKAYIHRSGDGSLLCCGCRGEIKDNILTIEFNDNPKELIYNLPDGDKISYNGQTLSGFGTIILN